MNHCGRLNRPFMHFCRNCRADLLESGPQVSVNESWDRATRASGRFAPNTASPQAELLLDLEQLPEFSHPPQAFLALRFLRGLLAVHQSGCFAALLHPFRTAVVGGYSRHAVAWLGVEPRKMRDARDERPFEPFNMPDSRHVVFSHAQAIYAVDTWTLAGWSLGEPRFHCVAQVTGTGFRIAAAPAPIDASKRCGVLLVDQRTNSYYWLTVDLQSKESAHVDDPASPLLIRLPIKGYPCQVFADGGPLITMSTPDGHWVWRQEDAGASRVDLLKQTWPYEQGGDAEEHASGETLLDKHLLDPRQFRYSRLHWSYPPRTRGTPHDRLYCYYVAGDERSYRLESYHVDIEANRLVATHSRVLDERSGYIPLGTHRGRTTETVFVGGKRLGRLTGARVEPWPDSGLIEDATAASGLIWSDPLIMMLRRVGGPLELRTLTFPNEGYTLRLPKLLSDPIVWSKWLFTHESHEVGGETKSMIVRRPLPLLDSAAREETR